MKRLKSVFSAFDAKDIPQFLLLGGCVLIGLGASRFHDGLGLLSVGLLIVLYVRPLRGWWSR